MERRGGLLAIQGDVLIIDGGIWVSYMVVLGVRVVRDRQAYVIMRNKAMAHLSLNPLETKSESYFLIIVQQGIFEHFLSKSRKAVETSTIHLFFNILLQNAL